MKIGRKIYYEKTNGIIILGQRWDGRGSKRNNPWRRLLDNAYLTLIFPEQLGIKHLIYGELMEHLSPRNNTARKSVWPNGKYPWFITS